MAWWKKEENWVRWNGHHWERMSCRPWARDFAIHFEDKKLATAQMKMKMELEKENLRLEQMEEKEIMMMDESVLPPMQQECIHQR